MPVIRPIRELQNTTEISHFAKTLNEPIFITKNGRNDLCLLYTSLQEWEDGIHQMLAEEKILQNGAHFKEIYAFEHEGCLSLIHI